MARKPVKPQVESTHTENLTIVAAFDLRILSAEMARLLTDAFKNSSRWRNRPKTAQSGNNFRPSLALLTYDIAPAYADAAF
jgi:hypothetical protein